MINGIFQAIIDILSLATIPLLCYWFIQKSFKGVWPWLGVCRPTRPCLVDTLKLLLPVSAVTIAAVLWVTLIGQSSRGVDGSFEVVSTASYIAQVVLFGLKSGIGEEIFFRGFVAKQLISKLGFQKGNVIQASFFALVHLTPMMNAPGLSIMDQAVRVVNAWVLGWAFGLVMEKKCGGSIVPLMIAHSLYNIAATIILVMVLYPGFLQ